MSCRTMALALIGLTAPVMAHATATTLDFDAARGRNGDRGYVNGPWIEDGYRVSTNRCSAPGTCLVTTGTTLSSLDRAGAALTNMVGSAIVTVARQDGGAFFLDALDMANNYGNFSGYGAATMTVDFTFGFADGTRAARTYTLANTPGRRLTVNTLTFREAALTSFSFTPRTGSSGFVHFDNVRLRAPVPEPAAWGMMTIGFCLAGGALRRDRRRARAAA